MPCEKKKILKAQNIDTHKKGEARHRVKAVCTFFEGNELQWWAATSM